MPPRGSHIDDGLLGLGHVRDDTIGDDEEDKVLGPVQHRGRRARGTLCDAEGTGTPPQGMGPLLPGNMVDNRGKVGGAIELDMAQAALICLQHPRNAMARRV